MGDNNFDQGHDLRRGRDRRRGAVPSKAYMPLATGNWQKSIADKVTSKIAIMI
jgi:hypothetical protein